MQGNKQVKSQTGDQCPSASNEFCHRHLAAAWLEYELGININNTAMTEIIDIISKHNIEYVCTDYNRFSIERCAA